MVLVWTIQAVPDSLGTGRGNTSSIQIFNLKVEGILLLEGAGALSLYLFPIQAENYDFTVPPNKYNQDLRFSMYVANEIHFQKF